MDHYVTTDRVSHMLTITRVFAAPRARVFEAFIDARQMIQWLGPSGYVMTHVEADVRSGGVWRGCMRSIADGRELWHGGIYREVVPGERLVFTFAFEAEGAPHTLVTITFEDRGAKTFMRLSQGVLETSDEVERYRRGWETEFDRLARLLGGN